MTGPTTTMTRPTTDVAFTPSVKAVQARHGSRAAYVKLEARGGWQAAVTHELAAFIAERDSFYFATANADGQPYIQHRGGPKGFLQVLDDRTLAFADYAGNRQYITAGNLAENPKAFIFVMDYATRTRIKLWGTARAVEDDAALVSRLGVAGGKPRVERAIVFTIAAWDANCPQHIPVKHDEKEVAALRARIAELERENAGLRRRPVRSLV